MLRTLLLLAPLALLPGACGPAPDRYEYTLETPVEYTTLDGMGESERRSLPKGQARVLLEILARPAVRLDKSEDADPEGRPLGYVYLNDHVFARFEGHLEERLGRGAYLSWHDVRLVNFPRLARPDDEVRPIEASLDIDSIDDVLGR